MGPPPLEIFFVFFIFPPKKWTVSRDGGKEYGILVHWYQLTEWTELSINGISDDWVIWEQISQKLIFWWHYREIQVLSHDLGGYLHSRGTRECILILFCRCKKLRLCEDCKLASPLGFFRGFGPRFHVHWFKSAWPAKNVWPRFFICFSSHNLFCHYHTAHPVESFFDYY